MPSQAQCFFIEPTGTTFYYSTSATAWDKQEPGLCPVHGNRHLAHTEPVAGAGWPEPKVLGPSHCTCGYEFTERERQDGRGSVDEYLRCDTGQLLPLFDPRPVGAMWYATWREGCGFWHGPDGRIVEVMTPGGVWCIDQRCSNCTMPEDNEHRCWVRHGEPPKLTVDKNGLTCGAGAGSILIGSFHGFLRDGILLID